MSAAPPINTMMIVDDNDVDQMLYRRAIERSGVARKILTFSYAAEALDYLRASQGRGADVILLDINMPRMDGFEFLDRATESFGDDWAASVVMLTSSAHPKDRERAGEYSAVRAYFGKPLTEENLREVASLIAN